MADLKCTKPVMLYFYWPEDDAQSKDKNVANQVRRCKLMDKILSSEEVRRVSVRFHCFRCNLKEVSDDLKKKHKVKHAPWILFFDVKGRRVWRLTNSKAKPAGLAKKMAQIAARCKKLLDKKAK